MPFVNGKFKAIKGRIKKFSPQVEKELTIAVSRYNQMRTRFIKSGGTTVAPRVTVQELKAQSKNTQELRQAIKRLKDYKKVSDFETEQIKGYRIATTKGERRTIQRLDKAMRQAYNKEIKKLEQQKLTASSEELINRIVPRISELKAKPTVISDIRSRRSLQKVAERYEYEQLRYKKFKTLEAPTVTQDHYLGAFFKQGLDNVPGGAQVYYLIARMTAEQWAKFCEEWSNLIDLDGYIYDDNVTGQQKVNAIANALGLSIDSSMLV